MVVFIDLCKKIQDEISNGVFVDKLPSLRELSIRYGVGVSTVKISLKRLKEQGYLDGMPGKCIKVNPEAAGNKFFHKNVVFYVHLNTLGVPFYSKIIDKLQQKYEKLSAYVNVINSVHQLEHFELPIDVLILSEIFSDDELNRVMRWCPKEKIIMFNQQNENFSGIGTDNFQSGIMAMEYLHGKLGHKAIGIVGHELNYSYGVFKIRVNGALFYAEKHPDLQLVIEDTKNYNDSSAAMEKIMQQRKVSAVFSTMDMLTLGIYGFCRENQLAIPEDLAVLGFDNQPFSECMSPNLSTYEENSDIISDLLFEKTQNILKGETSISQNFIPPLLLERKSTLK